MVETRSMTKAKRRMYAARTRRSHCRKLRGRTCTKTQGCKYASGTKRSFCRKSKNTKA